MSYSCDEVELSTQDFQRAVEALRAANVPDPYFAMVADDNPFYLWLKENYDISPVLR